MKVPFHSIPTEKELEQAYARFIHSVPQKASTEDLARYALWSRFDPRLGQSWVAYVKNGWKLLNALELREAAIKLGGGAVVGVLLEFLSNESTFSAHDKKLFAAWKALATSGISKARDELFYMGLSQLGLEMMAEQATFPSVEYEKWGFLANENLASKNTRVCVSPQKRELILERLLSHTPIIRTVDYWNAVYQSVSLRQAERDLKHSPLLRRRGNTKGKIYSSKKS